MNYSNGDIQKQLNTALYIRLSREDGDKEESNSVVHQRSILQKYVEEHAELSFYDEYVDDGYYGTNFRRPGFERLLEDGFGITEFDNFQYIKEKIIKKYINVGSKIGFQDDDNFVMEYIEDIQQIIRHMEETHNIREMKELLEDAYIIKIKKDSDIETFVKPGKVHTDISDEGIDLEIYYASIPYKKEMVRGEDDNEEYTDYEYSGFDYCALDKDFYIQHGISTKKLRLFGLITSPVEDGNRRQEGVGDGYWVAMGEYCPQMEINGIDDNFEYIERHPDEELARMKSAEIFRLLLA